MTTTNYLRLYSALIPACFVHSSKELEEKKAKMKLPYITSGTSSLTFQFDQDLDRTNYPKGLFPFFNKIPGAHSMCDYIVFAQLSNKLYCICIELKKGDSETRTQLKAGNCFAHYLTNTVNRINKVSLDVEYRFVSVHNKNIVKKGPTRCEPVKYDSDGYTIFKGQSLVLLAFLS